MTQLPVLKAGQLCKNCQSERPSGPLDGLVEWLDGLGAWGQNTGRKKTTDFT